MGASVGDLMALSTIFSGGQLVVIVVMGMQLMGARRDIDALTAQLTRVAGTLNKALQRIARMQGRLSIPDDGEDEET